MRSLRPPFCRATPRSPHRHYPAAIRTPACPILCRAGTSCRAGGKIGRREAKLRQCTGRLVDFLALIDAHA